jgi:hypothetical protein
MGAGCGFLIGCDGTLIADGEHLCDRDDVDLIAGTVDRVTVLRELGCR